MRAIDRDEVHAAPVLPSPSPTAGTSTICTISKRSTSGCSRTASTPRACSAANAAAADARSSQVRTVDRSERIRTYNFPENRVSDHRTGYKAYNLDIVLGGELDPIVQSAIDADEAARLAALGS